MNLHLTLAAVAIAAATTGCVGTHTKTASMESSEPVRTASTDSTMTDSAPVATAEPRSSPAVEPQAYTPMDNSRSATSTASADYSTSQAPSSTSSSSTSTTASSTDNYQALTPRADRN